MELVQLEYFIAVAENASFRQAAESLHVGQPALSRQIKKLERELGTKLFVRSNHGATTTPAGHALVSHAQEIMALVKSSRSVVNVNTVFELGVSTGLGERLGTLLSSLARSIPEIDAKLHRLTPCERIDAIANGNLHAAFIRGHPAEYRPGFDGGRTIVRTLWSEDMVVVTPAGGDRGDVTADSQTAEHIPLDSLADKRLYIMPREVNPPVYDATLAACSASGFVPKTVANFDSVETLIARVSATPESWSVIYDSEAASIRSQTVEFARPRQRIRIPTNLVYRSSQTSPQLAGAIDCIINTFGTSSSTP